MRLLLLMVLLPLEVPSLIVPVPLWPGVLIVPVFVVPLCIVPVEVPFCIVPLGVVVCVVPVGVVWAKAALTQRAQAAVRRNLAVFMVKTKLGGKQTLEFVRVVPYTRLTSRSVV